jgi:hypothetical protein
MSIFNADNTLVDLTNRIIQTPNNIVYNMYTQWLEGFNLLHDSSERRQQLLQMLGSYGGELFQLNTVLTTFMITNLSGVRNDIVQGILVKLNTLPNFLFNVDGTVKEVVVTPPSALSISYKDPLSSVSLVGGSAYGGTTFISGDFALTDDSLVPQRAGIFDFTVSFTPLSGYGFKTTVHPLSVLVLPLPMPSATFTLPASLQYDDLPKTIQFVVPGPRSFNEQYTGRNSTVYSNQYPPVSAGDYTFTITSTDPNYVGSESLDFTITPLSS